MKSIAIVGAGPIGLEAALQAEARGRHFTIYERGEVADALRQWGHVRMFSPFSMNVSARGLARLQEEGVELPQADGLLTGAEFRACYLWPLARTFQNRLREGASIRAIGRSRQLKGDPISAPERGARPFRLLVQDEKGEHLEQAELVLDCSGTFAQPNSLGDGGIPAAGEQRSAERISYKIPNPEDAAKRFAGRRVLVVGAGHSAATTICNLTDLPPETAPREINWLIRRERHLPLEEVTNDSLPERARLSAAANRLVKEMRVRYFPGATIESLDSQTDGIAVKFRNAAGQPETMTVDQIVAATGFRPDLNLARELQVQLCWATEGTYPLAASLLGAAGADCLATPAFGAETLLHPEPGYFTLGMKSYGRSPNFLLRTGYEQVASVFAWLDEKESR